MRLRLVLVSVTRLTTVHFEHDQDYAKMMAGLDRNFRRESIRAVRMVKLLGYFEKLQSNASSCL